MKRIQEEHVLVAISTCTYRHKYWEFWQKQHEVWPGIPLFMSWSFVFDCFEIVRFDSAFPQLQGRLFSCLRQK